MFVGFTDTMSFKIVCKEIGVFIDFKIGVLVLNQQLKHILCEEMQFICKLLINYVNWVKNVWGLLKLFLLQSELWIMLPEFKIS